MGRCVLAIVFALFSTAAGAEPKWIRLKTPNFELYSSAGERAARETLRNFEQVREFFQQSLTGTESEIDGRVYLVQFNSEKEYAPYRVSAIARAYYQAGADRDYIVMGQPGYEGFPIAVHEYAHLVVRRLGFNFPPWLNEGLAELYSTMRPQGGKVLVGMPIPLRLRQMFAMSWVPLVVIVGADRESPYYNEKSQAGYLYNEGWALVHMLALHRSYRAQFPKVLAALAEGGASQPALERIYAKQLEQIDGELQAYIRGGTFNAVLLPASLPKATETAAAERAPDFDLNLVLTGLLSRPGKEEVVEQRLEDLARRYPDRPEVWASLGYNDWQKGNDDAALDHFEKAYARGYRSPRFLWDYGRLAESDSPQRAADILNMLAEQQPGRAEVRLELASISLRNRRASEAYAILQEIKKVPPADAPRLFALMAYAQLGMGSVEAARASVAQLAKYARSARDRSELTRLQSYLASGIDGRLAAPAQPAQVRPEAKLAEEERPELQREPRLIDRSGQKPVPLPGKARPAGQH
jgi:tetratricopeptide (TPR) repeat protein